jgi:hypothetical protein
VKGAITVSRAIAAAAIGLFLLADPIAVRADNVEAFAGGQADFANYVFAGASVALPGSSIGNGLAFRGYFDTGGYDYVRHDLGVIRANFSGEELDAVYGVTLKHIWNDLGVGVNATYTGLSPYDSKNLLAGHQTELRLSLDGGTDGGPWRADWLGYYGTRLYDYDWSIDGTHAVSPNWRLGAAYAVEGNPSYHLNRVGPFAGVSFGPRSELQLSAGEAWESGFTPRAYGGATFFRRF